MKHKEYIISPFFGIISVILVVIVMGFLVLALDRSTHQANTENESKVEKICYMEIDTPYGYLYYPEKWNKELYIEVNDEKNYTISFYGKIAGKEKQQLFDIIFNGSEGDLLGYLNGTNVQIVFYDLDIEDWDEESANIIKGMSESASYLVAKLEKMENYSRTGVPEIEGEFEINTKYVKLKYPQKWINTLEVNIKEGEPYVVEFYSKLENKRAHHLFDLIFGGTKGNKIGRLKKNNVDVYVEFYNLNFDENWSEKNRNICCGMQEDFNYIIERLLEENVFEKYE